ncbi:MAG: hypothetical protein R3F37_19190 [Candidatus Competibacteraceae bacterium]
MRRFPQSALLDRSLAAGVLEPTHIDKLAEQLAKFHNSVARVPLEQPGSGRARATARLIILLRLGLLRDSKICSCLTSWSNGTAAYRHQQPILTTRKNEGFIRECHGIYIQAICCCDGQITVFDCIEFNDEFRWIDVMSDLGFLLMDLHQRQARPLGVAVAQWLFGM